MKITRYNLEGKSVTKNLDITKEQYKAWEQGKGTASELFTNLSQEDQVFFSLGMSLEEYKEMTKDDCITPEQTEQN